MSGKTKARKYDIANTNIANLGSDMERELKRTAANCEIEWKKAGKVPGLQIWRIENFQVVPWPTSQYGKFYSGDSYIVLSTYKKEKRDAIFYDVFFWIGEFSSQDEYGTAAYKTVVELDDYLGGAATQYREIQGSESARFKYLFKIIQFMDGGIDSGFNIVKPLEYRSRLLHIKGRMNVLVREVPISFRSLNSGDSFILDGGMKVFVWHGQKASPMEKSKAMSMAQALDDERGGRPDRKVFNEGTETDEFWKLIGGKGAIRSEAEGGSDDAQKDFTVPRLLVLSNSSGSLKLNTVSEGTNISRQQLKSDDVFILDACTQVIVWVGRNADVHERKFAMDHVGQYMREYGRDPNTPVCKTLEGAENEVFENFFENGVLSLERPGSGAHFTGNIDAIRGKQTTKGAAASAQAGYKGSGGPGTATDFDALYQQEGADPAAWKGRTQAPSAYSQQLGNNAPGFGTVKAGSGDSKPAAAAAAAAAGAGGGAATANAANAGSGAPVARSLPGGAVAGAPRDGTGTVEPEPELHAKSVQREWTAPVAGVISNDAFDPKADAQVLRKAMKGLGTNEEELINVLCRRTQKQRLAIRENYRQFLSRDLEKDIKGDTSGNFATFLKALVRTPEDRDCHFLKKTMKGLGTDNTMLIEMLCTKEAAQLAKLKESYKRIYQNAGDDLEKDVIEDTSGDYRDLLVALLQCKRASAGIVDEKQASLDAKALYKAGEGRLGTDEAKFIEIFTLRSFAHLKIVFQEYKAGFKHDIRDAIIGETWGNFRQGLLTICDFVRNPTELFAYRLFKAMKGLGTHNLLLIYTLIERSEIDLGTIKEIYPKKFGISLVDQIKDDTSGDFRKALLRFIGEQ